uniref:Nodulin-45 n=1 Tax=Lupinus luteus TaxID=3873 RepID=Q43542_LUPLU|nr:nodulin-45 [Lupinus luteus]
MDKSKICVSFILLFTFLLSSHVLAYELPETLLGESSFDSVTQKAIDIGFPSPPDVATDFERQEVVEKQEDQLHSHNDKGNVVKNPKPTSSKNLEMDHNGVSGMFSLRHSAGHGSRIPTLEEKENQRYEEGKVERNPTSSYDLERKRRSTDSSMHRFSQTHGYKTTSSEETGKSDVSKDIGEAHQLGLDWNIGFGSGGGGRSNRGGGFPGIGGNFPGIGGDIGSGWGGDFMSTEKQNNDEGKVFKERNPTSSYDLERKMRSGSSMPSFSHFVRQGYKTPSLEETGKSDVSKDTGEAHQLGVDWKVEIGSGGGRRSNRGGGFPGIDGGFPGIGGDIGNGGWVGDFTSTEPMNYKDASIMRHQNMKKFSELDRESQVDRKFGMKSGGKIYYGGVPRMEEDKKN